MSVDPDWQNKGIAAALFGAIWGLGIRHNKKGGFVGSRCPEFCKYAHRLGIEEYIFAKREDGQPLDCDIRFFVREGGKIIKALPNYISDAESLNYGVLLYHPNPVHNFPNFARHLIAFLIENWASQDFHRSWWKALIGGESRGK